MKTIEKLIFVEDQGNERAVMAKALFEEEYGTQDIVAEARGIVVLFSQPVNQKVKVLLAGDGLNVDGFSSRELKEEDFSDTTLVLAMEKRQKESILKKFPNALHVEVLTDITGDELEIMDPYGGELPMYGLCYQSLRIIIKKLAILLSKGEK